MLFIVLSLISVTFLDGVISETGVVMMHDFSFVAGFLIMLAGSMKIAKYILGVEGAIKRR